MEAWVPCGLAADKGILNSERPPLGSLSIIRNLSRAVFITQVWLAQSFLRETL